MDSLSGLGTVHNVAASDANRTGSDELQGSLCSLLQLNLLPRPVTDCADARILNLPRNNPCCRYAIRVKDRLLVACIDSGATLCLLSRAAYKKIKDIVGPLHKTSRKASGASGKRLELDGWVKVPFTIGHATFTYSFLVGNLSGIDCLLGLDWLQSVGATIDFSTMKAVFGPVEKVQLSSEPLELNYCRVPEGRTLWARSHTTVRCRTEEPVATIGPVMFEPTCISLGPGLLITSGIVQPDEDGSFLIAIQNDTTADYDLPDDIIVGYICDLAGTRVQGTTTGHSSEAECSVFRVEEHRLSDYLVAQELEEPFSDEEVHCTSPNRSETGTGGPGEGSLPSKGLFRSLAPESEYLPNGNVTVPAGYRIFDINGKEVTSEAAATRRVLRHSAVGS